MRKSIYIAFLLLIGASAFSQQKKYEDLNQLWAGYYSNIKLTERFSINSDVQGRTTDWYKQWSQVLGRTGLSFKPNEKINFTVGFADFLFFQKGNKVNRNEYRPWGELAISDKCNELKIGHRFRFEDRQFQSVVNDELVSKYASTYRFRYRVDFQYPIWKKQDSDKAVNLQIGNEIMINAGKSIVYNYFDQNRTWAAVLFTVNKNLSLQLQYMSIYQQLSNGVTVDRISVIRFNLYHTIIL